MRVLTVVLALLVLLLAAALWVLLRQIRAVRRGLERHLAAGTSGAVTLPLASPGMQALAARVNDAQRRTRDTVARARADERATRDVLADISHDLRTPLTTVRGYLQLLDRTGLGPEQRAHLAAARRQAEEVGRLADRLYEYAYLLDSEPELEVEEIDLGVLLGEVLLGMAGPVEAAGLGVEAGLPEDLTVTTDREKLGRIVTNLLRNAVQHGQERLRVTALATSAGVELQVANGMDPALDLDLEHLFDRFATAGRPPSGRASGLGLAIVRALAAQLGGAVSATREPDSGDLRVSVRLPHAPPLGDPPPGASAANT